MEQIWIENRHRVVRLKVVSFSDKGCYVVCGRLTRIYFDKCGEPQFTLTNDKDFIKELERKIAKGMIIYHSLIIHFLPLFYCLWLSFIRFFSISFLFSFHISCTAFSLSYPTQNKSPNIFNLFGCNVDKIDGENKFCGKFLQLISSSIQSLNFYIQIYIGLLAIFLATDAYDCKNNISTARIVICTNSVMCEELHVKMRSLYIRPW